VQTKNKTMIQGNILATKILVRKEEIKETKTSSGIFIPQTRQSPNISGTVVLTGTGTEAVPMVVKEGQTILYYERSAQPVKIGDDELFLLDVREVLFAIEDI